jgi:ParB family chromosome partitioning protein
MARKALGRGLSSLLGEPEAAATGLDQIPIGAIDPNPMQPRQTFPEESLNELAKSIRASGLVQPVLLRKLDSAPERFQLVAGERRWRAAKLAGLETVPAVIRELSDPEALELALTENLLREDLNSLDVARAYETLQQQFQMSHEEIAGRLGVTRSTVTNTLRLLRLAPEILEMLATNKITAGHARALLAIESNKAAVHLARQTIRYGLSVRQTEDRAARLAGGKVSTKAQMPAVDPDANVRAAVLELERTLGTRVRITSKGSRGRIEIQYFSTEDLNRIFEWITRRI